MSHCKPLLLPLAMAALLTASSSAHAEARRAAQSLPSSVRFSQSAATPFRTLSPAKPKREDSSNRDRDDRGRIDKRRYDHDRDDHGRGKEREKHKFDHHDRDDSPGC